MQLIKITYNLLGIGRDYLINELLLKFMKKGKPLYIRLYYNKRMKANDGILRICDEITIEELDDLYEYIVKISYVIL